MLFGQTFYGLIIINLVKTMGNFLGVAYIKYSKASEAFKAIEAMNGHRIESSNRRMKVLMATRYFINI